MTVGTRLQLRRNPAANWATDNPILQAGEAGVELDTGNLKIGDGTSVWNLLGYANATQVTAAIAALSATLEPLQPVSYSAPKQQLGVATGHDILTYSASDQKSDLDLIRSMGATVVRLSLEWDEIETAQGTFNWAVPDAVFDDSDALGLRVLFIILGTPAWARTNGEPSKFYPPTNMATYAAFCTAAVNRYKNRGGFGCHAWEIWNEPNVAPNAFSGFGDSYARYVEMLGDAYPAIKAADPTATVVLGGILRGGKENWKSGTDLDTNYLTNLYALGAQGKFDVLGYHPYCQGLDPAATTPTGLPSGSNLLTSGNAGTFDTNITGWFGSSATIARVTTPTRTGVGALSMAASAQYGDAISNTGEMAVTPGNYYLAQGYARAATAGDPMSISIVWLNGSNASIGLNDGQVVTDTTTGWSYLTCRAVAPAGAVYAQVKFVNFASTPASRVHYLDDVSFYLTTDTGHGWNRIASMRAVMVANGDGGKPMWLTEFGQPTGSDPIAVTEAVQATYLTHAVARLREFIYVEHLMVYSARNTGTTTSDPEQNYGVVHFDRSTKAAFAALAFPDSAILASIDCGSSS